IKASYDEVFPAEDDPKKTVDDNCALMYLNEGTLLNNCRQRYVKKQIYTYVANILISINPYEEIDGLYSIDTIKKYRGKSLGQMPPHVYAVADKAYREMRRNKESQSIIVSGESGAGKTESQKAILRYLCENWGAAAGPIQKRILETNPILEAFGNAKTLRNNNSSRFGKFVEIHFGTDDKVAGGFVSHYLLEKSRVCRQAKGERNYHIFYQLIAGAPHDLYKKLRLAAPDNFKYLKYGTTTFFVRPGSKSKVSSDRLSEQARKSGLLVDAIVDDAADFSHLVDALGRAGLTSDEIGDIWCTVAGVLHLGNVEFDENPNDNRGGCKVAAESEEALMIASELLGLEVAEMKMGLVSRIMQATKGGVKGTLIRVPLKPHEAAAGRDALAKAFYSKLFDWLVARINKSIPFEKSVNYIGVLDIAGFEFFEVNSFEQFCINYCNEKLQDFFNERILKQEQELYAKEGLNVPKIEYSDNHDCIGLVVTLTRRLVLGRFTIVDKVAGGFVSHYLLEKSRVCRQAKGERNYHIFYQLIAGAPHDLYKKLRLAAPDNFKYLKYGTTTFFVRPGSKSKVSSDRLSEQARKSGLLIDAIVDDAADFSHLVDALGRAGLTSDEIGDIWCTVAGVLHLGNVEFDENPNDNRGGCKVAAESEEALMIASELLGLEVAEMKMGLVSRIMQATKGGVKGTLIRVPLKPHEAAAGRDALAKAFYSKLFDWLKSVNYIGVLDIAGFEFFEVNSFEQFCINYCNEKLQDFFNERILKQEQELYAKEGLNVPKIEYSDNHDCIELFERKPSGLLDLLDEESRLPRPTPQHYTMAAYESNKGHFRLESPRRSRLRQHRDLREDEAFLVRHYAGTVCYQTAQFLEKNNDTLHNSLEFLVEQSSVKFIRNLFEGSHAPEPAPGRRGGGGRLQAATVGGKFRTQLTVLLEKLKETGTHFVRCVKPNSSMSAGVCDGAAILSQLKCAGMASVLKLMQKGFPSRTSFADLYNMYQRQLPPDLARLDPRLFCKCLFHALGLNNIDFKFGQTKVFFRPGKFAEFDQLLRQDPEQMRELINQSSLKSSESCYLLIAVVDQLR
ncbi:myosin head, partial [Teladorsagia circumcincta]